MATNIHKTNFKKQHITDIIISYNINELNMYASNQCLPNTTHFEKEIKPIFSKKNPHNNTYITGTYMYVYHTKIEYINLFGQKRYMGNYQLLNQIFNEHYIENIWVNEPSDHYVKNFVSLFLVRKTNLPQYMFTPHYLNAYTF